MKKLLPVIALSLLTLSCMNGNKEEADSNGTPDIENKSDCLENAPNKNDSIALLCFKDDNIYITITAHYIDTIPLISFDQSPLLNRLSFIDNKVKERLGEIHDSIVESNIYHLKLCIKIKNEDGTNRILTTMAPIDVALLYAEDIKSYNPQNKEIAKAVITAINKHNNQLRLLTDNTYSYNDFSAYIFEVENQDGYEIIYSGNSFCLSRYSRPIQQRNVPEIEFDDDYL